MEFYPKICVTIFLRRRLLAPSGYAVLDLLVFANVGERVSINAGLFNLTDKTYIRWADTSGIETDAPARFTQPGFNAALTLRVEI